MTENLLAKIVADTRTKSLAQFQLTYTGWYILGGPADMNDADISYNTELISPEELRRLMAETRNSDAPPQMEQLRSDELRNRFVYEIRKKPDSAFSGWISIGRAVNNDVVLRFPTISKLHARLEIETTTMGDPTGYRLIDNQSTGKTVLNGSLLEANQPMPVSIGDVILFGNIRCIVVDAATLWESLR